MWRNKWLWSGISAIGLMVIGSMSFFSFSQRGVDFNSEIRPILNKSCLGCHGGVKRQGGLSLLFREDALSKDNDSGIPAIIPGNPSGSELMSRIKHHDLDERMPQDAEPLTETEIALLEKWIKQGAKWEEHWAYIKPNANIQPPSLNNSWVQHEIDRFVLAKLKEKITYSFI